MFFSEYQRFIIPPPTKFVAELAFGPYVRTYVTLSLPTLYQLYFSTQFQKILILIQGFIKVISRTSSCFVTGVPNLSLFVYLG